jgi:hypothetical protein
MSGDGKVVRGAGGWRVHDPNAEREVEEQVENPQNDIEI